MTVGHCAIHLSGCGRYKQAPSSSKVESWWRSWWRSRGLAPWKLQRICILRYLILGLILPNNRWMVMHFFMCIAVQSHKKIPKVQSFQFSSFLSEKMCMSYSSSRIIFLNLRTLFKSYRSVPRSALHFTTSE